MTLHRVSKNGQNFPKIKTNANFSANQELQKRRKACLKLVKDKKISENDQVLNGEFKKIENI